jgi:hypothetical protein
MRRRTLLAVGTGLLVLILGFFVSYQTLYAPEAQKRALLKEDTTTNPYHATYTSTFSKGTYTVTGSIELPNQCHRVQAEGIFENGVVRVSVSVPPDEGICLEISKEGTFKVSVDGEEGALVEVYVNGTKVPAP